MEHFNNAQILSAIQVIEKKITNLTEHLELTNPCPELRRAWIPRTEVMNFFGYAETQMTAIAKKYSIEKTKVGKRILYSTSSLQQILSENIF